MEVYVCIGMEVRDVLHLGRASALMLTCPRRLILTTIWSMLNLGD